MGRDRRDAEIEGTVHAVDTAINGSEEHSVPGDGVKSGRLEGLKAVVTAAGNGIGRAITDAFVAEGAHVLATDISADALDSLDGAETSVLDATDPQAIDRVLGGRVFDVVVNGVGWVHHGSVLDCDPGDWQRSFTINVDSMYHVVRATLPPMIEAGGGSIINIASVASSLKGFPNRASYCATKGAVIGLTKSIASDYIAQNIRCNAICPGTVDSPSLRGRIEALGRTMEGGADAALAAFVARQPMGRLGTVEEIASLAVYLASPESGYTTGHTHVIDGGIMG